MTAVPANPFVTEPIDERAALASPRGDNATLTALTTEDFVLLTSVLACRYFTVEVTTQNSRYLVVARQGVISVVCPDGMTLTGDNACIVLGRLYVAKGHTSLLRTTTVKGFHVIEN